MDLDQLTEPPAPGSNPIAWLVWHLARVQDHHVAELLDDDQIWVTGGWAPQFGLDPDPQNTGYGHNAQRGRGGPAGAPGGPARVPRRGRRPHPGDARALTPDDLDRVVDRRWDPPVTLGVRLVSVADDCLQHAGQAAYVRGLLTLNFGQDDSSKGMSHER